MIQYAVALAFLGIFAAPFAMVATIEGKSWARFILGVFMHSRRAGSCHAMGAVVLRERRMTLQVFTPGQPSHTEIGVFLPGASCC